MKKKNHLLRQHKQTHTERHDRAGNSMLQVCQYDQTNLELFSVSGKLYVVEWVKQNKTKPNQTNSETT